MARFFSLWEKKKGHRHSGSRLLGGLSAVVIYSTIMLIGVVLFVALITYQFGQADTISLGFSIGGFWIRMAIILLMIGLGGYQTVNTIWTLGVSPERKSAITIKASNLDITQSNTTTSQNEFPSVPKHEYISGSPGVRLQHRLPANNESTWLFVAVSVLVLILLGVASTLTMLIANEMITDGKVNWIAASLCPVFIGGSVWACNRFYKQLLEIAAVGPSNVEVSAHPLIPGETYKVFLYQSGLLRFRRLDLVLACFEHVTYQQGTDIRTETRRVSQKRLLRVRNLRLDPGHPFEHHSELTIPDGAMHSFQSPCNMVSWVIVLTAVSNRWPRFTRRFPIIVHPVS